MSASKKKCLGVLGLLFGHKLLFSTSGSKVEPGYCLRCGMVPGQ